MSDCTRCGQPLTAHDYGAFCPDPPAPLAVPTEPITACGCAKCDDARRDAKLALDGNHASWLSRYMILCPDCGNKRCPKASDHDYACTGSNEVGQEGSLYAPAPPAVPTAGRAAQNSGETPVPTELIDEAVAEDARAMLAVEAFTAPDADWLTIIDSLRARIADALAQRVAPIGDDMVERAARAMEVHQVVWIDHEVGWSCGCDERGDLEPLLTLNDANDHIARAALTAALGAPSGEGTP